MLKDLLTLKWKLEHDLLTLKPSLVNMTFFSDEYNQSYVKKYPGSSKFHNGRGL